MGGPHLVRGRKKNITTVKRDWREKFEKQVERVEFSRSSKQAENKIIMPCGQGKKIME